jgi:hypothetical protein
MKISNALSDSAFPDFYSPEHPAAYKKMMENYIALVTQTPERAKQELIAIGVLNADGTKSINYYPERT